MAETPKTDSPEVEGIFPILIRSLWDAANMVTGLVGLTVVELAVIVGVLVVSLMMWHVGRQILRKQAWTLDEKDTPALYVRLEKEPGT